MPQDIPEQVDNLKDILRLCGYTMKDIADTLGVSRQTVSNWNRGKCLPTTEHLNTLAELLDVRNSKIYMVIHDRYISDRTEEAV